MILLYVHLFKVTGLYACKSMQALNLLFRAELHVSRAGRALHSELYIEVMIQIMLHSRSMRSNKVSPKKRATFNKAPGWQQVTYSTNATKRGNTSSFQDTQGYRR